MTVVWLHWHDGPAVERIDRQTDIDASRGLHKPYAFCSPTVSVGRVFDAGPRFLLLFIGSARGIAASRVSERNYRVACPPAIRPI